jgi:predicted dehydrogenase
VLTPVTCGVIGLGWMGRLHAAFLASAPLADLRVCCDIDPEAARHCPRGCRFTADLAEALADVEAVFVCTPPDAHRRPVEQALAAGLHVFCEKPLATSVDEAAAMIAISGAQERLVVGHIRRFDPRFLALRSAIETGRLGRPLILTGGVTSSLEDALRLADRVNLTFENAIHDIDAMRWLAGDVVRVHAEALPLPESDHVGSFVATLRFASGAVGCLHHTWAMSEGSGLDWEFRFRVNGERGLAEIDGRDRGVEIHAPGGVVYPDVFTWPDVEGALGGVLALEDGRFLELVRGTAVWPLSLNDAVAAVAVAQDLDASIEQGAPIAREQS